MLAQIEDFIKKFFEKTQNKSLHIVSHFDTDGITSAAILAKTMQRLKKPFSIKILKQLEEKNIKDFPENKVLVLLDLGSNSLDYLKDLKNDVFIIDHHEPQEKIPENITIINPLLLKQDYELSTAELTYLFSKFISNENKDLAYLAVIGMIGDILDKNINKIKNQIITDADIETRKGILLYPSTRPLNKTIEFSSRPFIPGATGNPEGTIDLLREAGIMPLTRTYKSLIDLTKQEMNLLSTAILLRIHDKKEDYIGNIYLIKFFNKLEDARELSAIINSCSRMGFSQIALMMCLGNPMARKQAERIYAKYRQNIISALRYVDENKKIEGREYVIINAGDNIKDTLIGTIASILSFSSVYKEGTIIITMAYDEDKIKVSTRIAGRNPHSPRNLKKIIEEVINITGGECGGHKKAAGCIINKSKEQDFINEIRRKLDIELIKI